MNYRSRGQFMALLGRKKFGETITPDNAVSDVSDEEPFSPSGSEYLPSDESRHTQSVQDNEDDSEHSEHLENLEEEGLEKQFSAPNKLTGRPARGRKRKYISQNRQLRKKLYNENKPYITTRDKEIPSKTFNADFTCTCKNKCTEKIPVDAREKLFTQYWTIGSFPARCALLNAHVKVMNKKRTYTKKESKRKYTRKYYIQGDEVCKNAFLKTLQITQNRIDVALKKKDDSIIRDERGIKSGGRNKCPNEQVQKVIDHINLSPQYISHYCRSETNANFLHPDLNLAKMYDLYKEYSEDNEPVSLSKYKLIFYKNFNLRFKSPKKDTCLTCDTYKVKLSHLSGNELEKEKNSHEDHLRKAQILRETMNTDLSEAKTNPELETLTFDMQKTHPLPKIPTGIAYYKRQLNLYNLGIHVGSSNQGIFNVWTENVAGRATQEVGSCLLKYIKNNIHAPIKELRLWSDSCGGQNRSIKLVLLLIHALLNHSSLEVITIRFLLSGHSFLPNDSEFGDVESALKIQERLYTDLDYINVMEKCRRKKKFIIKQFKREDFVAVDNLIKQITNRKVDLCKKKISWLSCHEIKVHKSQSTILLMKNHVTQNEPQRVSIEKAGKGRKPSLQATILPLLWPNGKNLSEDKFTDLRLIEKLVPKDAKWFYKFLSTATTSDFNDDLEGFGLNVDFEVEENLDNNTIERSQNTDNIKDDNKENDINLNNEEDENNDEI